MIISIKNFHYLIMLFTLLSLFVFAFLEYSYWWDELYSVSLAGSSWSFASKMTLLDVHPPLYTVILKIWIEFFGDSEFSTRFLSSIFCLVSLAIYSYYSRKLGRNISEKLIPFFTFLVSWPLIYYGNEARSYSLLIMFSTYVFFKLYTNKYDWSVMVALLFMSLTHYFGFALALQIVVLNIINTVIKNKKINFKLVLTCILLMIWPIIHITNGAVIDKTGGNFWITSYPLQAFVNFLQMYMLVPDVLNKSIIGVLILLTLLTLTTILLNKKHKLLAYWLAVIIVYLSVIACIDIHTPISTTRNLVVLLPLSTYVISISIIKVFGVRNSFYLYIIMITFLCYFGFKSLQKKIRPHQEFKEFFYEINTNKNINSLYFFTNSKIKEFFPWQVISAQYYSSRDLKKFNNCEHDQSYFIIIMHKTKNPSGLDCTYETLIDQYRGAKLLLAKKNNSKIKSVSMKP